MLNFVFYSMIGVKIQQKFSLNLERIWTLIAIIFNYLMIIWFITNLRKRTPTHILTDIFCEEKVSLGTMIVLCSRCFHGIASCKHQLWCLQGVEGLWTTCQVLQIRPEWYLGSQLHLSSFPWEIKLYLGINQSLVSIQTLAHTRMYLYIYRHVHLSTYLDMEFYHKVKASNLLFSLI